VRELIERIRWGNVARLCAVVAAALLVVAGPRGCSNAGGEPAPLPPDARVAPETPPVATVPKPKKAREPRRTKGRAKPRHRHRRRMPRPAVGTAAPAPAPVPNAVPATPAPPPAPVRPAPQQPTPQRGRAPEFL
jgi:hypothetical protein